MSRASEDLFDLLHSQVVTTLMAEINAYRNNVGDDGTPAPLPVPPALLAQAIKLLKDNGVDSPARAKAVADTLAAEMPQFDEFNTAPAVPH